MAFETPEQELLRVGACLFEKLTHPQLLHIARMIGTSTLPKGQSIHFESLSPRQLLEVANRRAVSEYMAGFSRFCDTKLSGKLFVEQVGLLYKSAPGKPTADLARRIFVNEFKNGCLELMLIAFGLGRITQMVQCHGDSVLRKLQAKKRPAILAFWHIGPQFMIGPAMMSLGLPALIVIKDTPAKISIETLHESGKPYLEYLVLTSHPTVPTFALKRCIEHLQKGGIVAMAADGRQSSQHLDVPFLDRMLPVSPGVSVLARLTGAAVVPLTWNWIPDTWEIDFQIHEPMTLPKVSKKDAKVFDLALMSKVANWFERHTLSHADQIRIDRMPILFEVPLIKR